MHELTFYFDDAGQPGLKRGLKWHTVAAIYTYNQSAISELYSLVKKNLIQINPFWKDKELKGVHMKTAERKIVLEGLKNPELNLIVGDFDTHSVPENIVKNRNFKFLDSSITVDPTGMEAREFAVLSWPIIEPIKNELSKVILYYDGKKFKENQELYNELETHLKRQLNEIPFEIHTPESEDCEGVQLSDVLANSYYKNVTKNDKVFEVLQGRVKIDRTVIVQATKRNEIGRVGGQK